MLLGATVLWVFADTAPPPCAVWHMQVGKDKNLDYDPCCLNYFSSGDFLVVGGSDRKVDVLLLVLSLVFYWIRYLSSSRFRFDCCCLASSFLFRLCCAVCIKFLISWLSGSPLRHESLHLISNERN